MFKCRVPGCVEVFHTLIARNSHISKSHRYKEYRYEDISDGKFRGLLTASQISQLYALANAHHSGLYKRDFKSFFESKAKNLIVQFDEDEVVGYLVYN
jgi:hypothetical protein